MKMNTICLERVGKITVSTTVKGGVYLHVDDAEEAVDVTLTEEEAWKLTAAISAAILRGRDEK